ncbi:hypothetical protein SO802_016390 [Lithocarpus litseifolius]|uniref:RNase H type-1 domain-containing protein n=1 Tax=Lithocarpus litseifolius TaxID=425828 RepID=A0AAW2CX22_9ROSI
MIYNGPKCFKPAEAPPRTICARNKIDDFMSLCYVAKILHLKMLHRFREANKCADALTNASVSQDTDILFYNSPLSFMVEIFCNDYAKMYFNRLYLEAMALP